MISRVQKLSPWVLVLIGASIGVGAYLQALRFPFVFDDFGYVINNSKLAELRFTELWRLVTSPYNDFSEFLPLRDLSYWLDINLFGLNPAAFRIDSIILYLLCLPLVYVLTSELWRYFRPTDATSAPWSAAIVTALFALHPSHAEAVVWIAGRKDVLSTLFSLLALWFAIRAKREQSLSTPHASASLAALLAAMLSKASAVAVAPVIALLWLIFWWDIPAHSRRKSFLFWPLGGMVLAACIALVFAAIIPTKIPLYFGVEAITRSLAVLGWLTRLSVSPESRHFLYPVLEDPYLPVMVTLGAAVLVATAISVAAATLRKRMSLEGFAMVTFLLLCLPCIQLIPYQLPSLVSDRWLALPVWPAALFLVALAWRLKFMPRAVILLVLALSWSVQTVERPRDWRSFDMLMDADLRTYPGFYMPAQFKVVARRLNSSSRETANSVTIPELREVLIGIIDADYAVHIDAVSKGTPQEAMDILWKLGVSLKQPPAQTKWNPPMFLFWKKSREMLSDSWEGLSRHFPDDVSVSYNAGLWMLENREYQDAIAHLRVATDSQRLPESVRGQAFMNLGLALMESGHIAKAEATLHTALEQSPPDFRAYCLLSKAYNRTGQIEEAKRAEAKCFELVPSAMAPQ